MRASYWHYHICECWTLLWCLEWTDLGCTYIINNDTYDKLPVNVLYHICHALNCAIEVIVQPIKNILSSFTHTHAVPNQFGLLYFVFEFKEDILKNVSIFVFFRTIKVCFVHTIKVSGVQCRFGPKKSFKKPGTTRGWVNDAWIFIFGRTIQVFWYYLVGQLLDARMHVSLHHGSNCMSMNSSNQWLDCRDDSIQCVPCCSPHPNTTIPLIQDLSSCLGLLFTRAWVKCFDSLVKKQTSFLLILPPNFSMRRPTNSLWTAAPP